MWARGLIGRRPSLLALTAVGVALAVGLLASIGVFLGVSKATMTKRAAADVAVDWQVQVRDAGELAIVADAVRTTRGVVGQAPVWFATVSGLHAATGGTTQTTGAGVVISLPPGYGATFPATVRLLVGTADGVLLTQQTAANLHAALGDSVQIDRTGMAPTSVTVSGIIDLPAADSLFQVVGAAPGSQPQAPPDNVVLVPAADWHAAFDPLVAARPDLEHVQIHAALDRRLPADPAAAYTAITQRAHHLEALLAGSGIVGDNLAASLGSARSDALYAQVLFLFLGLPGAVLAGLLTIAVAAAGSDRRRREQALLRLRGATTPQLVRLAGVEAAIVGGGGGLIGLATAAGIGRTTFGTAGFGTDAPTAAAWMVGAFAAGLAIATLAIIVPAWRDARQLTVSAASVAIGGERRRWSRFGADFVILAVAAVVYWLTSRRGYQLVLAPEGVATVTVNYWALLAPLFLWIGAGLLTWRLTELFLRRGRRALVASIAPLAGSLAPTVAASLRRQRRLLAHGAALVAMTVAFAASTATFNATYRQQVGVDALLSNGADVTVNTTAGGAGQDSFSSTIASVPGVQHVEPLIHRFAYVGNDLQDIYGVRAASIGEATRLQDSYFQGGSAKQLLGRLASEPDAVLVAAETVNDFQLQIGDPITLRLQDARTHEYRPVTFHYVGIAKEFPTAPRDSFLVANADYIATATGNNATDVFLVDTGSSDAAAVSQRLTAVLGPTARVNDIDTSRHIVASSLTAVDLAGLTRVELSYAVVLVAAATGLVLVLGFAERRRTYAITAALGARPRQLGGFIWSETLVVTLAGFVAGTGAAIALTEVLVNVLTGVFDPPPDSLAVPWSYLALVSVVALASVIASGVASLWAARRPSLGLLRT
jgi:putative ABC transport system permease protein